MRSCTSRIRSSRSLWRVRYSSPRPANTQSDTPSTLSATDTSGTRNTAVPSTSSIASASQSENQPRHATSTTNSSHAVTVGNTVRRYRF